jgi:hypothetical protein
MARTFSKYAWLVALTALLPAQILAQNKPLVMPLVPAADWRQVDSHPLPVSAVSQFGGDPAVEQEYGVKNLELRTYQLGKWRNQVVVETAPDATSAYGLFTFYRTPAMAVERGVELATGDANETLMARGGNFLRFLHGKDSAPSVSDNQALLIFVGGSRPSTSALQNLPAPMPAKNLVPGSEKYILGLEAAKRVLPDFRSDLIGFEQGAEIQLGRYQEGKNSTTLISISYPTPQIARTRFGSLKDLLGVNREQGDKSIYGSRHGSYVFLVLNAASSTQASALMNQFQVTEGVSWDQKYNPERSFTLELIHMILAILLLTAILIGVCVLGGVLLFLSRRIAAKFFPNSSWAHPEESHLIRLNLSGL